MNYTVVSFMMSGHLHLEEKVTQLAERSCCKVRETIKQKHTLKYLRKVLYTPLK